MNSFPGMLEKSRNTLKGVMIPIIFPFNLPGWPVQKSYVSWRMSVDCYKLNQEVMPIIDAVSDSVFLLEQISIAPGTWYTANLANVIFPILIHKTTRGSLLLPNRGQQYTFMVFPQW